MTEEPAPYHVTSRPAIERLRERLEGLLPGPIVDTAAEIAALLRHCWPSLSGSGEAAMATDKLGRIEQLEWAPPCLFFTMERHGAAKLDSKRAELQRWRIDLAQQSASFDSVGRRQLRPKEPRFDARPSAEALANAIAGQRADDPRLRWGPTGEVRVLISEIVPQSGPKKTVDGRRRRLTLALQDALQTRGWVPVKGTAPHTYRKKLSD